ncbi:TPA: DUF692 family protein [Legionella pneumophila]|nr:DUF692 family protein [Legionella pneumophila]HAT8258179.1 DUF692 family protein [Legionella pneumophila]HAT8260481.1 DUF692 family protein [Legionella pneumophila]HAT8270669.1 DUF692 family protein [Legionella pneumophila]HAT8273794.1 DUF692 family protein [Legionella pneumophila]
MSFETLGNVGLGLRTEFSGELLERPDKPVSFLEIAPENWMKMGGNRTKALKTFSKRYPLVAHGLSLSIGGPAPLDELFIEALDDFFNTYQIDCYSEHLSYCSDAQGYFHDLLPIPFTTDAVDYVSQRIITVQQTLKRQIAFENSSYYYAPGQQISEGEFIKAVLEKSDCLMLLDVNNVYVNSVNHGYDAYEFIQALPSERIAYIHIAGHERREPDLIIDTHGAEVISSVWNLLQFTYECHGIKPTLLERDSDIPPLDTLLTETQRIYAIQSMEVEV